MYGVVRSSPPIGESPPGSEAGAPGNGRGGGAISRALNDTFYFGAGIAGRFRRTFARSPQGPGAGRDGTLDGDEDIENDDRPPAREVSAPLADIARTQCNDPFAGVSKRPLDDEGEAFAALSLPVAVDEVTEVAVAELADEPTASPPTAGQATAIASLPVGAYPAIAIGIASVALALVAGNSGADFPGAALERAMLTHAPAAAADPPEWMYMDPSLPKHVLAAHMAEEPTPDLAWPAGSGDGDAVPPASVAVVAVTPQVDHSPVTGPLPTGAFGPVVPQPAARPGNAERAGNGGEPAYPVPEPSNPNEDAAASQKALLAALPPPPPVARVARANPDPQQRGAAAAKAGSAPTVLDKSALAAGAEVPKLASGGFEVQLIAVSRRDQAVTAWTGLVRENTDLLGTLEPAIVGGEGRGSLFRLRTGSFASNEQAQSLCASLKQRNVDCVVVHRGG